MEDGGERAAGRNDAKVHRVPTGFTPVGRGILHYNAATPIISPARLAVVERGIEVTLVA